MLTLSVSAQYSPPIAFSTFPHLCFLCFCMNCIEQLSRSLWTDNLISRLVYLLVVIEQTSYQRNFYMDKLEIQEVPLCAISQLNCSVCVCVKRHVLLRLRLYSVSISLCYCPCLYERVVFAFVWTMFLLYLDISV